MKDLIDKVISNYYLETNKTPNLTYIANSLKTNIVGITPGLDELVKDGYLTYYADKNSNGISSYHLPERTKKMIRERAGEKQEEKKLNVKEKITPFNIIIGLICAVMLFIVFNSMQVSIHFSTQQTKTFLDDNTAFCLSLGIVLYISFAPEGAFLLKQISTERKRNGKKKMPFIGKALLSTAAIALFMSMCFTVIGQFNANSEKLKVKSESEKSQNNNFETLKLLKSEESEIQKSQKRIEVDILFYQKERDKYKDDASKRAVAVGQLNKLNADYKKNSDSLTTNREKQQTLISSGVEKTNERFSFYTWLASVTGLTAGAIEFIMYILPALFADIISPLGVSLVVFLLSKFFGKGENAK